MHRSDAARLVRLGLESAPARSRLHAVAEESIPTRDIAAAIGDSRDLPVTTIPAAEACEHFGFVGGFAMTMTGSSSSRPAAPGWR